MRRPAKKSALLLATGISILAIGLVLGFNSYSRQIAKLLSSDFTPFIAKDFVHNDPEDLPITQFNFTGKLTLILIPSLMCSASCPELEQFLTKFEPWQAKHMQSESDKNKLFQLYVASLGSANGIKSLSGWQNMIIEADDKILGQLDFDQSTTRVAILDDDAKVVAILPVSEIQAIERRLSQTYSRVAMYKFLTDVPMFRRY